MTESPVIRRSATLLAAGTIAGTTLGAGIFAIPYLMSVAGILPTVGFLAGLSVVVIYAHTLYWRVLRDAPPDTHLLELAREHLGPLAARGTFVATILGLALTVTAYLILGTTFVQSLTGMSAGYATLLFWFVCSLPLAFRLKRFIRVELFMTLVMSVLLLLLILTVPIRLSAFPLISWQNLLLPFGPLLFALAGWTAVEPALAAVRRARGHRIPSLALGTVSVALAYLLFALAFGSAGRPVTLDVLSGVMHLPHWQVGALLVVGLFAILTSYLPMNLALKNALRQGLEWKRPLAFTVALFLPYLLVLSGFNNFLTGIELVGGVFLAAQYIAILQVSRKALRLKGWHLLATSVVSILFAIAAILHTASFVAPSLGLR